MTRAATALALLFLATTLTARVLDWSAAHRFPIYDELDYLRLARGCAARGGLPALVAGHVDGSYREDNHHPLFVALLVPLMRGSPADFPRAKLAALLCALLLLGTAAAAARDKGVSAALLAAGWATFSPEVAYYGHTLVPDLLYAALFALALGLARRAEERPGTWAAFGLLAGAAWLAKGNGEFLLLAPLSVAVLRRGRDFWRSPAPWTAALAFAAAGSLLLWRNSRVWGDPFHHLVQKGIWINDYSEFIALRYTPQWSEMGASWYFRHHTLAQAAADAAAGLLHSLEALTRAFSIGPFGDAWELLCGIPLLTAALAGMARAWRRGERDGVLCIAAPCALLWLAFAWRAKQTPAFPRYDLPLAAAMLPFAWEGLEAFLGAASPKAAAGAAVLLCAFLLTAARGAWTRSPLSLWSLPPFWPPTSAWLHDHAAGRYLVDYRALYSAWDAPPDSRFDEDFTAPPAEVRAWAERHGILHAVLDISAPMRPDAAGPADAGSPATFLGWPRCYRAPVEPNPLVVYGRDCRGV